MANCYASLFRSQKIALFGVYLKNTALRRHLDNPVIWSMTQRGAWWRRQGSNGWSETKPCAPGPAPPPTKVHIY